jgi:hypothetical protein|tara:strand:+ start:1168 stop:1980 length:813 start_codon:yes stop_codon:yes gene_type:complete
MTELNGLKLPESWDDVNLRQFSAYNKALVDFQEATEPNEDESDEQYSQRILTKELILNFEIVKSFTELSEEDTYALDYAVALDYVGKLFFLKEKYKPKKLKSFEFQGRKYNLPELLPMNTKFGQYIESLQAEMVSKYTDKNSVIYLAHQAAHIVDYGEKWDAKERDLLAEKFEELPMSVGFDFAFFLSKKCQIYSLAYLRYEAAAQLKKLPLTKRLLLGLVGLKRYTNWQSVVYLINLTKLRLIVFYIQIQEKYSDIYRILRSRLITTLK